MSGELAIELATGLAVKALILSGDRTKRWDGSALTAIAAIADAAWATGMVTMSEQRTLSASATRLYVGDFPAGIKTAGEFSVYFYDAAGSPTPGQASLGQQDVWWDGAKDVSPSDNVYTAEAQFTRDQANLRDLYTCQWLANGIVVPDTEIGSPTLTVHLDDDTVLINAQGMTQETLSDLVVYAAATTERLTIGDGARALFQAEIDGAVRSWPLTISRDS